MSIRELISLPESKTLEFKETMPNPEAIAKTACGFANGGGGAIIIGVADKDRKIIGINERDISDLEEKISNIVYGTGVLRIRKYIQEKGLIQPEFKENNGFFKAIFFNAKVGKERKEGEVEKEGREVDREVEKKPKEVDREVEKLTENQKMILDLIKNDPHISKLEMSNAIGIRVSSIEKNITTLKEKGYLRRLGPAKGGYWQLLKSIKIN